MPAGLIRFSVKSPSLHKPAHQILAYITAIAVQHNTVFSVPVSESCTRQLLISYPMQSMLSHRAVHHEYDCPLTTSPAQKCL